MQNPVPASDERVCDVLVVGPGQTTSPIITQLATLGIKTIAVWPGHPGDDARSLCAYPVQCRGFTGDFKVSVADGVRQWTIQTAAIVIALDEQRIPDYAACGLEPSGRIQCLTDAEEALAGGTFVQNGETVILLNGLAAESHPGISSRMVDFCLRVHADVADVRTIYLTDNLKVAARDLESRFYDARGQGTFIYKLDGRRPVFQHLDDGRVRVVFFDPGVRREMTVIADRLIVDERSASDPRMGELAGIFRLRTDANGFGQEDNVRRLTHFTNRRGIFMAGSARAVLSDEERLDDSQALAAAVSAFLSGQDRSDLPEVRIDTGRCGRCLTCYRTCPYAAIRIGQVMEVMPAACQACGLCVAACPAKAIQMQGGELVPALGPEAGRAIPAPCVVAFCCQRSADAAFQAARATGTQLPGGLLRVQVPCGGRVGTNDIATAFEAGADGVMVLTCHHDNCHSQSGSRAARKRSTVAAGELAAAGVESQRVLFATVAANMGTEIARLSADFEVRLRSLAKPVTEKE